MAPMDQEKKAVWVAALRSGDYTQGKSVLHRKVEGRDQFCCLGVLCDLAAKAGVVASANTRPRCECESCQGNVIQVYDGHDDFLPPVVYQWAGLPNGNPSTSVELDDPDVPSTLSYLNDNGKTFEEIAAIIEREF